VGWQGWETLRSQYRQSKGKDFTDAEFHERALKEGALPFSVLRNLVFPAGSSR
jgi:uncharacterized protein (DUF885 family)